MPKGRFLLSARRSRFVPRREGRRRRASDTLDIDVPDLRSISVTAYRADRVDRFLTLLWHPYEDRAVGVKLKGFRFIFERMREILQTQGVVVPGDHFMPLITAFEVAMTAGLGAAALASAERKRLDEKYAKA